MDIDSVPATLPDPTSPHGTTHHLNLPSFSSSFPLPFRVLFLVGLAQLLWATNLHILHLLGLDTSWILDFRDQDENIELRELSAGDIGDAPPPPRAPTVQRPKSASLHGPVYKLFLLYSAWVGAGWVVFRAVTGGDQEAMERWRVFVGLLAVGAAGAALAPWQGIGQRDRLALRKSGCLALHAISCIADECIAERSGVSYSPLSPHPSTFQMSSWPTSSRHSPKCWETCGFRPVRYGKEGSRGGASPSLASRSISHWQWSGKSTMQLVHWRARSRSHRRTAFPTSFDSDNAYWNHINLDGVTPDNSSMPSSTFPHSPSSSSLPLNARLSTTSPLPRGYQCNNWRNQTTDGLESIRFSDYGSWL